MWRSWLSNFLGSFLSCAVPCQVAGHKRFMKSEWVWSICGMILTPGAMSTLRKTCLIATMSTASLAVWLGIDLVLCGERLTTNCLGHGTKAWPSYLIEIRVNFWGQIVHDSLLWWYTATLTEVHFGSYTRYCMWRTPFFSGAQIADARLPMQLNYALLFLIFVGCLWNMLHVAPGFCRNVYIL
jgi:hypothetical protein